MAKLRLKKLQVELMKVSAAKAQMELKAMEYAEEIERISVNLDKQDERINELELEIAELDKE